MKYPKLRVMMDWCSDPIWNFESGGNLEFDDLEQLKPKTIKALEDFRQLWCIYNEDDEEVSLKERQQIDKMALDAAELVQEDYPESEVYVFLESKDTHMKYNKEKVDKFEMVKILINQNVVSEDKDDWESVWAACLSKEDEDILKDETKKGQTFMARIMEIPDGRLSVYYGDEVEVVNQGEAQPVTKNDYGRPKFMLKNNT
tara:strand:- start:65746 stop:66348 length:603 start_codon:yes stop_codon:yes gene_type:complete